MGFLDAAAGLPPILLGIKERKRKKKKEKRKKRKGLVSMLSTTVTTSSTRMLLMLINVVLYAVNLYIFLARRRASFFSDLRRHYLLFPLKYRFFRLNFYSTMLNFKDYSLWYIFNCPNIFTFTSQLWKPRRGQKLEGREAVLWNDHVSV
jgi:predicted CDP-diglyceride synthetase/phosphatidate cytidylyltransferase